MTGFLPCCSVNNFNSRMYILFYLPKSNPMFLFLFFSVFYLLLWLIATESNRNVTVINHTKASVKTEKGIPSEMDGGQLIHMQSIGGIACSSCNSRTLLYKSVVSRKLCFSLAWIFFLASISFGTYILIPFFFLFLYRRIHKIWFI